GRVLRVAAHATGRLHQIQSALGITLCVRARDDRSNQQDTKGPRYPSHGTAGSANSPHEIGAPSRRRPSVPRSVLIPLAEILVTAVAALVHGENLRFHRRLVSPLRYHCDQLYHFRAVLV